MSSDIAHVPVLVEPVLEFLAPREGGKYVDATLGAGGHALGILEKSSPTGKLLGIDVDPTAIAIAEKRLARYADRVVLVRSNFVELKSLARKNGFFPADGILLDLGISSMELSDEHRGFSFASPGALDMRFDLRDETTASDLVNHLSEKELADLIFEYGEERASRRIARAIVHARPIGTAAQLGAVIERAVARRGRIHPATRTFQALRIAVNRELERLEQFLVQIADVLAPTGRVAIISYHSLEDRRVKNFFRGSHEFKILTKHPIQPSDAEIAANPRSRSAKLRVAERLSPLPLGEG
jgi:16S rRNA (cytosine1402-N4)-methyltransferase